MERVMRPEAERTENGNAVNLEMLTADGPAWCGNRTYVEDVAEAALAARAHLEAMDPERLATLVKARRTAIGLTKVYSEGDQRFLEEDSESGKEEEEEDGDFTEDEECVGLLENKMDRGPAEALERAKREYKFDLLGLMRESGMPFLNRIRVVNYMRALVQKGTKPEAVMQKIESVIRKENNEVDLSSDKWLKPVIPGDSLLTAIDDCEDDETSSGTGDNKGRGHSEKEVVCEDEVTEIAVRLQQLLRPPTERE